MKHYLVFLLIAATATAQRHHLHHHHNQLYTTLDEFKHRYKRELTAEDSLNMRHVEGELMVLLTASDLKGYVASDFEYRDKQFIDLYKKVAFNKIFQTKDNNVYLTYWKDPLKIFVAPSVSKTLQKEFRGFVKTLTTGIDSLKVSFVDDAKHANFFIYCTGDFDYEPALAKSKSEYYNYWNARRQLYRSAIKLDKEIYFNDTLLMGSLQRLFLQALGNFALTDAVDCKSILSNCDLPRKSATEFDRQILKYHYSYGICKGVDQATFEQLHETALYHRRLNPLMPYKVWHMPQ